MDVLWCIENEDAYETTFAEKSFGCKFSTNIQNCRDSEYLVDCIGCSDCFMCANLQNGKFCIMNVQYSKEEFIKKRNSLLLLGNEVLKIRFKKFLAGVAHKQLYVRSSENTM